MSSFIYFTDWIIGGQVEWRTEDLGKYLCTNTGILQEKSTSIWKDFKRRQVVERERIK